MKFTGQFQKQSASTAPVPFSTGMFRSRPFSEPTAQRSPSNKSNHEPLPLLNPDYNRMFGVQPKLTVGAPNDQYEQEADRVADQVMSMPDTAVQQPVQREVSEEEEVQTKPLAASITPLVQREAMPEEEEVQAKAIGSIQREETPEEEEVQTKSLGSIQREEMPQEDEEVQTKAIGSIQREEMPEEEEVQAKAIGSIQREETPEEEEVQTKPIGSIQREEMPEEEEVQTKSLGSIQREDMPEEEEVQTKPALQRSTDGSLQAGGSIESRLNSSKGGGSPLPDDVRLYMEPRFGADFSQVRVHTGSEAVQMNRDLNAQAFTHQQDLYFGAGKAPGKDALTAHELTHVVQQTSDIQRECEACERGMEKTEDQIQTKPTIQSVPELTSNKFHVQRIHTENGRKKFDNPNYIGDSKLEACLNDEDRLRPFETGPSVTSVQNGLKNDGQDLRGDKIGVYGSGTGQAVMAFKRKYNLGFTEYPDVGPGTMRRLDELGPTTVQPNQPPPTPEVDRYEIQIKAWIPHERVVDPEESVRAPLECTGVGLAGPREYTSQYHGDGHTDYPGGMRGSSNIQFNWDGQKITELTHQESYGLTIRFWSCKDVVGQFINQGSESRRATEVTRGGIDDSPNSFFLEISTSNPLIMSLAPPIRARLTGVFNSDGTLHLVSQTTRFPSHGFQVIRNGALVQEQVTNDASSVEALGPSGLFNLFSGLTDFSNIVVRNLNWKSK